MLMQFVSGVFPFVEDPQSGKHRMMLVVADRGDVVLAMPVTTSLRDASFPLEVRLSGNCASQLGLRVVHVAKADLATRTIAPTMTMRDLENFARNSSIVKDTVSSSEWADIKRVVIARVQKQHAKKNESRRYG